jgi:hypothetical protein
MHLELSATKDSVWYQIFSDGVSWRNFIYFGKPIMFSAADSFNVHIGNSRIARLNLDSSVLPLDQKGVSFIKIDKKGTEAWNQSKWNKVFHNRLD